MLSPCVTILLVIHLYCTVQKYQSARGPKVKSTEKRKGRQAGWLAGWSTTFEKLCTETHSFSPTLNGSLQTFWEEEQQENICPISFSLTQGAVSSLWDFMCKRPICANALFACHAPLEHSPQSRRSAAALYGREKVEGRDGHNKVWGRSLLSPKPTISFYQWLWTSNPAFTGWGGSQTGIIFTRFLRQRAIHTGSQNCAAWQCPDLCRMAGQCMGAVQRAAWVARYGPGNEPGRQNHFSIFQAALHRIENITKQVSWLGSKHSKNEYVNLQKGVLACLNYE